MWKLRLIFFFSITCIECIVTKIDGNNQNSGYPNSINGEITIKNAPYQAILEHTQFKQSYCGAVIISKSWLLTAAQCVRSTSGLAIRTGSDKVGENGQLHYISKVIKHPNFIYGYHDIALIKVVWPIQFTINQNPISIAEPYREFQPGTTMTVSGFGVLGNASDHSRQLKIVEVPMSSLPDCQLTYSTISYPFFHQGVIGKQLCAGCRKLNTCEPDIGSPGIVDKKLVAIGSYHFFTDSGALVMPSIYTNIAKYYWWILDHTEGELELPQFY